MTPGRIAALVASGLLATALIVVVAALSAIGLGSLDDPYVALLLMLLDAVAMAMTYRRFARRSRLHVGVAFVVSLALLYVLARLLVEFGDPAIAIALLGIATALALTAVFVLGLNVAAGLLMGGILGLVIFLVIRHLIGTDV